MKTMIFLLSMNSIILVYGQNDSVKYYSLNNILTVELPKVQKPMDTCTTCLKPYGKKFKVNLPIDKWSSEKTDSFTIYSLQIIAPDALYIDIILSSFIIQEGSRLLLYSANNEEQEYSYQYSKNKGEYYALTVKGYKALLQFYVPKDTKINDDLRIASIVYNYDDIFEKAAMTVGKNSLDCEIDVNCSQGDSYRDVIRSVVFITGLCNSSWCWSCSGGVLNNTTGNYTPYILTAHHCTYDIDGGDVDLKEAIFYFNYQNSTCNGTLPYESSDKNPYKKLGAELKAGRTVILGSDFALLKLYENIPRQYNAYYSGWSRERHLTGKNVVGIHHPKWDPKKISFGHVRGISSSGDYLEVQWDEGTVEGVSSGSPLFRNKQVVGQLSGGSPKSGPTCDNLGDDLYGHFASSWGGTFGSETRLRDWLDPNDYNPDDWYGIDPNNTCVLDLSLSGVFPRTDYQQESVIIQASNTIYIANAIMQSNGNYLFRAGNSVDAEIGTTVDVEVGSEIETRIEACAPFLKRSITNSDENDNNFRNEQEKHYENNITFSPNPFLDHTHFDYSLKSKSTLTLTIHNVFGQEVARLIDNQIQESGTHTLTFDASALPAGIYFCTFSAQSEKGESFREVKKLVKLK